MSDTLINREGALEQKRLAEQLAASPQGGYSVCSALVDEAEQRLTSAADAMARSLSECRNAMEQWLEELERLSALLKPRDSIFRSAPSAQVYGDVCRAAVRLEECSRALRGQALRFAAVGELLTQAELCVPNAKRAVLAIMADAEDADGRTRGEALLQRLNACETGGGALKQRLYGQRLSWGEFCNNAMTRFLVGLQNCADLENDGAGASLSSLRTLCAEIRCAAQRVL